MNMATIDFGRVSALPPFALLQQALPRLTRHELEGVVELLIDRLDAINPNADSESNGDELDFTGAEDDYQPGWDYTQGAGCPISDPAEDDTEDLCLAGDDGCGPVWQHGCIAWGYRDETPVEEF